MTKAKKPNLSTVIFITILSQSFLVAFLLAIFWVGSTFLEFRTVSAEMEDQYIAAQKNLIRSEVDRVIDYIGRQKSKAETRLKEDIKSQVDVAFSIAQGIYHRNKDHHPVHVIEKVVIETLRSIRFNNGRGYFFATQLNGIERLFPDKPELENRNLIDLKDVNGQPVIRDMIELVRTHHEGYYKYLWTKPNTSGNNHPKIAFIRYFEPFDWFIGTGEYIQNVEDDIKNEVIEYIEQITFGSDGYVFVGTFDGISLAKPAKSRNMWNVQDENGVKIVQELIKQARSGGGFVEYVMPKFPGLLSAQKLSYADQFPEWQWYIGAGIYVDAIYTVLAQKRDELKAQIRQHLFLVAATLMGVVILTLLFTKLVIQRINSNIRSFTRFFNTASTEALTIDKSKVSFSEFEDLAASANRMIAERNESDKALNETLEWNQTILRSIQSGILVIDAEEKTVIDVNPEAATMIGLPREAIIGQNCHTFSCPAHEGQGSIRDRGPEVDHEEQVLIRSDGSQIPILKTATKKNMMGRPYLIESFLNLSKQKKLEAQLQQAQKIEAIGTLTGGIAHDFNNILSVILGNTELAQLSIQVSDEAYPRLEGIKEATSRAKKIVNQLLSYSRHATVDKAAVNLNRLAEEAISFIRALIPTSIHIEQQIASETCTIYANATQVHQILINLCVNAAHAAHDETGTIWLKVANVKVRKGEFDKFPTVGGTNYAELVVKDNGSGISPEIMDRIFDPYFTTKAVGKGTGMGLAVVMGIVHDHDGAISIASQPNHGTTVRIVLPLTNREPEIIKANDSRRYPLGHAETILFIDDEEQLIELGKDLLTKLNYRVEGYTDAAEAMERFRGNPEMFDLIISDMTMPKMNGFRVIEEARRIRPDIPVIICSGYNEQIDDTKVRKMRFHYIQKPIEMETLSTAVRERLDQR